MIPENIKLPHLTGCVTFSATGHLFIPLIILPNKKTMRKLGEFANHAYFASSAAGWMTKNLFSYYCLLLICQVSYYRLSLPENIRHERILLLVDGHPSRYNFEATLILYLFDIDLALIPPHTSHLLQSFDVAVSGPFKTYFKKEMINDRFDYYLLNGFKNVKETAQSLRKSMLNAFLNALTKSCTKKTLNQVFVKLE